MKIASFIACCAVLCAPSFAFADEAWVSLGRMQPDGKGAFLVLDVASIKKEPGGSLIQTGIIDLLAPAQGALIAFEQRVDCTAKTLTTHAATATRSDGVVTKLPMQPMTKAELGPAETTAVALVCASEPKAPSGAVSFPTYAAARDAIRSEPSKY